MAAEIATREYHGENDGSGERSERGGAGKQCRRIAHCG
jgi:hypothetical protein